MSDAKFATFWSGSEQATDGVEVYTRCNMKSPSTAQYWLDGLGAIKCIKVEISPKTSLRTSSQRLEQNK